MCTVDSCVITKLQVFENRQPISTSSFNVDKKKSEKNLHSLLHMPFGKQLALLRIQYKHAMSQLQTWKKLQKHLFPIVLVILDYWERPSFHTT
jgi:hypothetical protein